MKKIIKKMIANQKDWRIEQLETIAKQYKVSIRKTGGSHVVFYHANWAEILCVPAHRPIKPVYIKKFINLIKILEVNDEST